jgi:hypothetical protein
MEKTARIGGFDIARTLAVGMLFAAVARWPYGFYTMLRWTVCLVAVYGAFRAFEIGRRAWMWLFVVMAALFNPLAPVHLARSTWAPVDIAAAIVILLSFLQVNSARGPRA